MKAMAKVRKKINPALLKVGWISFFTDLSSEFLYPITPIFLSTILGADATIIGLIEGSAEAAASLLKTYFGRWSDRIQKRKLFIVIGYLFSALSKPITGFAQVFSTVLFARILDRTGKGIRTAPRDALIAEVVPGNELGAAYGFHRAMDTAGAVIGPLLALGFLYLFNENLRSLYFLAVIPGFISVWIAFSLPNANGEVKNKTEKFRFNQLPKNFYYYLFAWGIFSLVNSSDVFLILKAKHEGLSTSHTILLYAFFNFIYATGSIPFGKLSDRIGRKALLVIGLFLFSIMYFGFAESKLAWHFWLLFMMNGLFMAMTEGVGKAYVVDFVPSHLKATALGLLGTITGLSTLLASLIAGLLWDHFSPSYAFYYGSIGAFVSAVLLIFMKSGRLHSRALSSAG